MAMKKKPGRSKVEVGIPSTEAVFSAGNNNASGSLIANLARRTAPSLPMSCGRLPCRTSS